MNLQVVGLVGHSSGRASSGPLIEAIKAWDIRQTNASEVACWHLLAFPVELQQGFYDHFIRLLGSAVSRCSGTFGDVAEDAYRRQILNYIADVDEFQGLQVATDGRLVRDHGEDLNMMVRVEVYATVGRSHILRGCRVPRKEHRGSQAQLPAQPLAEACIIGWVGRFFCFDIIVFSSSYSSDY